MAKISVGLDIGTSAIKVIELERSGRAIFLKAGGRMPISPETTADIKKLAAITSGLFKEFKIGHRSLRLAVPDSQIVSRVIQMPRMSEAELAEAMRWEADQYVPMPLSDVFLDYQVLKEDIGNNQMRVLLVAAPQTLVKKYEDLLRQINCQAEVLETALTALIRSFRLAVAYDLVTLLVDIGASSTDLCIIKQDDIFLTRSFPTGGNAFTRVLAEQLSLSFSSAEEYKRTYGFEEKHEGKVRQALNVVGKTIIEELRRVIKYYESENVSYLSQGSVVKLVLTGGSSKIPGLPSYLAESLGLEIEVLNPFNNIDVHKYNQLDFLRQGELYATAVGLALGGLI